MKLITFNIDESQIVDVLEATLTFTSNIYPNVAGLRIAKQADNQKYKFSVAERQMILEAFTNVKENASNDAPELAIEDITPELFDFALNPKE